jgi:hypothetical protein
MDYILTFEDGSDAYLSHHGVKGMKWGVRNAETLKRYASGPGRMGRKDAKKAAQLKYAYGARSRTAREKHNAVVSSRKKKLGENYTKEYDKAYSKVNHEKLAYKAEKRLAKDRKLASKSDEGAKTISKVGGTVGSIAGSVIVGGVVYNKTKNVGAAAVASTIGAVVGESVGKTPARRVVKRHQDSRRRLNYSY